MKAALRIAPLLAILLAALAWSRLASVPPTRLLGPCSVDGLTIGMTPAQVERMLGQSSASYGCYQYKGGDTCVQYRPAANYILGRQLVCGQRTLRAEQTIPYASLVEWWGSPQHAEVRLSAQHGMQGPNWHICLEWDDLRVKTIPTDRFDYRCSGCSSHNCPGRPDYLMSGGPPPDCYWRACWFVPSLQAWLSRHGHPLWIAAIELGTQVDSSGRALADLRHRYAPSPDP